MFAPLDGAIVPASKWRRGDGQVPRSALPTLAAAVHAAMGAEGDAVAAACEGRLMADAEAVEAATDIADQAQALLAAEDPTGAAGGRAE